MPYYQFELIGGDVTIRHDYATQYNLRRTDNSKDYILFYTEHPATLEQLRRSHGKQSNGLEIVITEITKEQARMR